MHRRHTCKLGFEARFYSKLGGGPPRGQCPKATQHIAPCPKATQHIAPYALKPLSTLQLGGGPPRGQCPKATQHIAPYAL